MGLDMYLNRKRYISHNERKELFITGLEGGVKSEKVVQIEEEVMYWRKVNAIHNWFVSNVQEGEDNCKEYYVSKENIEELLSTIEKIIDDRSLAEELLPTQGGFFFGGLEYDEYYWDELKDTKTTLKEILENWNDNYSYYYSSSW